MFLAVIVVFLNEERLLPRLLNSIASQVRPPDRLLLVDDGSNDASPLVAQQFANDYAYAEVIRRPRHPREADRLATAAELKAYQSAAEQLQRSYDVIAKLDGDLCLPPELFEHVMTAFEDDPQLGITGAHLSVVGRDGELKRERNAPWHVRGPNKFYRRECYEQIAPLPPILGWDTIDEARARLHGWRVAPVSLPGKDPVHLRPTGTYDGAIRGFRRRGVAAWGYGADPASILASAAVRIGDRPPVLGTLAYLGGWLGAAMRRDPRAEPEVVRFVRRERRRRILQLRRRQLD